MSEQITLAGRIKELIQQHGTLRAAGRAIQVDCSYLSRMEKGEKFNPSETILRRMGLREVTVYERAALSAPPAPRAPSIVLVAEIKQRARNAASLPRDPEPRALQLRELDRCVDELASLAAPAGAGVEEFPLPELPAPTMSEINPYLDSGLDPYHGESPLYWYSPAATQAYARAALRSYSASLGLQARTEGKV